MNDLHASGPFDVSLAPLALGDVAAQTGLGRMSIDKHFHGDLDAASQGEMLAWRDAATQSGGYVALERVQGRLGGRSGGFMLQHSSTMDRGVPTQSIAVVPGSGSGELAGIEGSMEIVIAPGGAHSYRFDYRLPDGA